MQAEQSISEPLPPSESPMVSMVLRLSVGFLYLVSVAYMSVYLYKAASVDSLSEGFQKICENPWATSALVDYLTGLCLSIPYIWSISDSTALAVIWSLLLFFLGNPILLLRVSFDLFTIRGSLSNVILKPHRRPIATKYHHIGIRIVQTVTVFLFMIYVAIVVRALALQPVWEGWEYIKNDPWSWVTFVDNMLGIIFAMTFILCREKDAIWSAIMWGTCLTFLGNGVTVRLLAFKSYTKCIYVFMATLGHLSISEAYLNTNSVTNTLSTFHRID